MCYLLKLWHTEIGILENKGSLAISVKLFFKLYLCLHHLEWIHAHLKINKNKKRKLVHPRSLSPRSTIQLPFVGQCGYQDLISTMQLSCRKVGLHIMYHVHNDESFSLSTQLLFRKGMKSMYVCLKKKKPLLNI